MSGFENPADVWNNRYSNTEYVFGTELNHFLVESAEYLQSGMEALLVADGEGRNSIWLAQQGIDVTAFDISEVAIKKAKHLARENEVQVQFSVSNCENWQWHEKKYDLVVAIFIQFADPHARERLFANMIDSLKPGGTFILQGYTPKQLEYKTGGPPLIDHLYSEDMLRNAFSTLEIIKLQSYERDLQEGVQHVGRSALIGLVAKKPSGSLPKRRPI